MGVLAEEALGREEKVFVCIDGIDHAARAKISLSFLSTLPLPSELPDGVCFVIVGQPVSMYREQYPAWLLTSNDIEHIYIPKLSVDDIELLICSKSSELSSNSEGLASLIFEKTDGNNLSVAFAVEEIKSLQSLDDAISQVRTSGIAADIQQYYDYIWNYMKNELSRIVRSTTFPESIVACPLLLMNGRVNVRILSRALTEYRLDASDWEMILDRLYPLVVPTEEDGEYSLFHNDFRVFLMGIINEYQARYENIALRLSLDLFQNDEGLLTYVMAIPLLKCANKMHLIPQYFTPEFVINALAEGISKQRLDEYVHLAYKSACDSQDTEGLLNVYLAMKTLCQHSRYFEYFDRKYECIDYPEISFVADSEIRVLPVEQQNLDEFDNVLSLCHKLCTSRLSNHYSRGLSLYQKWFGQLTPLTFVPLCIDSVLEEKDWELRTTDVGIFLERWGNIAAELGFSIPQIGVITSRLEKRAVNIFCNQYFDYCISNKKFDFAVNALISGYVSEDIFADKLEILYYCGAINQFEEFLLQLSANKEKPISVLFAHAIKITCDFNYVPDQCIVDSIPLAKRIFDESCFSAVLQAFLLGCRYREVDDSGLINLTSYICSDIEDDGDKKEQLEFLVRIATLLGKYYWICEPNSSKLFGSSIWLLRAQLRRSFDYSRARRFLLYTLLHSQAGISYCNDENFIDALRTNLFEVDSLGMYYKTSVLDYLEQHDRFDIISEYIRTLYGEKCCNISLIENKAETHAIFASYGDLVYPDMMKEFSLQLKWDVVGYMGYKEYAMYAPADCFDIICKMAPEKWKDIGIRLYCQSEIADNFSNHAAYDIKNSLSRFAISCGLEDYWELCTWDDDFMLNPNRVYNSILEFIDNATTIVDLEILWVYSCGVHSWYTQDGRKGMKCIWDACIAKSQKIGVDFETSAIDLTPQWVEIVEYLKLFDEQSMGNYCSTENNQEIDKIRTQYSDLTSDDALALMSEIRTSTNPIACYNIVLEKVSSDKRNFKDNMMLVLGSVCEYLSCHEWTYNRFESIIKSLLSSLGGDAFWAIAKCTECQLSDYDYQVSTRNLQLLFKLYFSEDKEQMQILFDAELRTQVLWINGNEHIDVDFNFEKSVPKFPLPQSLSEMVLYILLEQIGTNNSRRIESAIFAIYLLGNHFSEITKVLFSIWDILSKIQKECLLFVIARWVSDGYSSKELCDMLVHAYYSCTELSHKYLLHSILLKLKMLEIGKDTLTYDSDIDEYVPTEDSVAVVSLYFENFLSLIEHNSGSFESVDVMRKYISLNEEIEDCHHDYYAEPGDYSFFVINRNFDMVMYSEEKKGKWASISLLSRKSRLLSLEDPFLLTELPRMVFDETWFPLLQCSYGKMTNEELTVEQMSAIANDNIGEGETVLAACLWYPWGHDEGKIYWEYSKVDSIMNQYRFDQKNRSVGNYGLLIHEGNLDESVEENLYRGGVNLFDHLGGSCRIFHGNCQLAPSTMWRRHLGCKPSLRSPYMWVNETDDKVLRFERIASPYREAINEKYIRQPILFRWVCDRMWLENILDNKGFKIWKISYLEDYPNC